MSLEKVVKIFHVEVDRSDDSGGTKREGIRRVIKRRAAEGREAALRGRPLKRASCALSVR